MTENGARSKGAGGWLRLVLSRVAIALVLVGASIGIVAILRGELTVLHVKIIVTTFAGAFYLGTALMCLAAEEARPSIASRLGLVVSASGFLLFAWGVWSHGWAHVDFWKALWATVVVSVTCGQSALLVASRVQGPARLVVWTAQSAAWVAALISIYMVYAEVIANPALWRALGIAGIVDVAATSITAILHRVLR